MGTDNGGGGQRRQFRPTNGRPRSASAGAHSSECKNDAGLAGNGVTGGVNLYPTKNSSTTSTTGVWDVLSNSWWGVTGNSGGNYVIYSANYLNYYYDSTQRTTNTKIEVLQQGVASILNSTANVNIGLMRYDERGAGGMVLDPVLPIATNRAPILADVNKDAPSGTTPLSESPHHAYLISPAVAFTGNNSHTSICSPGDQRTGLKTCAA